LDHIWKIIALINVKKLFLCFHTFWSHICNQFWVDFFIWFEIRAVSFFSIWISCLLSIIYWVWHSCQWTVDCRGVGLFLGCLLCCIGLPLSYYLITVAL
jgi:hypothetical protein